MEFKKFIAMFLVVVMIAGSMVLPANATDREPITIEETESVSKTANFSEDSNPSCGEITQASMNAVEAQASFSETIKNGSTINSSDLNCIERVFNCNLSVASAEQIFVQETDQVYTRYTCKDKTELSFDENGDLFKISTIYAETSPRIDYAARKIEQSSVLSAKEAKKQCINIMPEIRAMFNIVDDYPLTDVYDFDDEYVFYTFEKLLENGVYNPYQSVKVVFNKRTGKFSVARKFEASPNALVPAITESDAICVAGDEVDYTIAFDQVKLTYITHRQFSIRPKEYDLRECYLVYEVSSLDNNLILYIDALSGLCIGSDCIMSESGLSCGIQESTTTGAYNYNEGLATEPNGNKWRRDKILWAAAAMRRLGYSTSSTWKSDKSLISDIKDYLKNNSRAYAFYFTGHGSNSALGFKYNGRIYPSDVTGNWHFVFLDACSTAADATWANAFKINGYSNRAFLGWSKSIRWAPGHEFAEKFWPRVNGKVSIRQAAVDAAADVPGEGTTPIKFYGDRSYTGKAWT